MFSSATRVLLPTEAVLMQRKWSQSSMWHQAGWGRLQAPEGCAEGKEELMLFEKCPEGGKGLTELQEGRRTVME